MENGEQPIHPAAIIETDGPLKGNVADAIGLTKREFMATMAMQGYIAAGSSGMPDPDQIAAYAVKAADELLKALSNKQP